MLSTEEFYAAFVTAGFLRTVTWQPSGGGASQTAQVRYRAPTRDVLSGDQSSVDYEIRFLASQLVGLKRGEVISIDGPGAGNFKVQESPVSRLDNTEFEVKLSKL